MGLKFLYYVDTSANWILFTLGIICVPFGVGGMILVSPIMKKNVFPPWYHGTGIWVGLVFLSISIMMPFARFNSTFLRLAIALNFVAMMIASIGLGVSIDEFINWFENPIVKTFGGDTVPTDNEIYVSQAAQLVVDNFREFDMFHKARVIVVMGCTLIGICMMLFRIVTLGLVLFDEFTTRGYDVYTPEEEMMHQALEERDNQVGSMDQNEEDEQKYQPMLYAGGKPGVKLPDLPILKEDDETDDESYYEKIKAMHALTKTFEDRVESIYDPYVFSTTKMKGSVDSLPTYTDESGIKLFDELNANKNADFEITRRRKYEIDGDKTELMLPKDDSKTDPRDRTESR